MEFMGPCCGGPVLLSFAAWFTLRWKAGKVPSRTYFTVAGLLGAFVLLAVYSEGRYIVLDEGLVSAGCDGNAQEIEQLVAWGANPNKPNDDDGYALPCAVGSGHVGAARALLKHGADPNLGGFFGISRDLARGSDDPAIRRLFGLGPKGKR